VPVTAAFARWAITARLLALWAWALGLLLRALPLWFRSLRFLATTATSAIAVTAPAFAFATLALAIEPRQFILTAHAFVLRFLLLGLGFFGLFGKPHEIHVDLHSFLVLRKDLPHAFDGETRHDRGTARHLEEV